MFFSFYVEEEAERGGRGGAEGARTRSVRVDRPSACFSLNGRR